MVNRQSNYLIKYPNKHIEFWYSEWPIFYSDLKKYSFRQAKRVRFFDFILFKVDKFFTTSIDLKVELSNIFSNFSATTKNEIRKCGKLNIKFIAIRNFIDLEIYLPVEEINKLIFLKEELGRSFLVFISYDLETNGAFRWLSFHSIVARGEYFRLFTSERNRGVEKNTVSYANRGLHFFEMEWAQKHGFKVYDFGGIAKKDINKKTLGINSFKLSFGGQENRFFNCKPRRIVSRLARILRFAKSYKVFISEFNGLELNYKTDLIYLDDLIGQGIFRGTPSGGIYLMNYFASINQVLNFTNRAILDVGCSDGQAIKMFCDLGCNKLGGVEIRKELFNICSKNIAYHKIPAKIYNCNILDFELISEYDIIYLYNPFDLLIMEKFLQKIIQTKKSYTFIYVNAVYEDTFFNFSNAKIEMKSRSVDIWGNNILVFDFGALN